MSARTIHNTIIIVEGGDKLRPSAWAEGDL